jgi:CubicO group peptidase (beta-lactamase class C family)
VDRDLGELIEAGRARFGVPGVAVGVIRGTGSPLTFTAGTQKAGSPEPVTDRTVFAIGSCTKAMTAYALSTMVDDNLLDWDEPVRSYLPRFRLSDLDAETHTSLTDLLAHRTGLPRHDLAWFGRGEHTPADVVASLAHLAPSRGFRQAWQYNNMMYVVAGELPEAVSSISWRTLVTRRVIEQFGLSDTSFSLRDFAAAAHPSSGHTLVADAHGRQQATVVAYRSLECMTAAGGVNSSLRDMVAWLDFVMHRAPGRLFEPAMAMPVNTAREEHRDIWPEAYTNAYALGWFLGRYCGRELVHHAGNIDGFAASTSFLPGEDIGVVVLANLDETPLPAVLTYSIYDRLLGQTSHPWSDRFQDLATAMAAGRQHIAAARSAADRDAPPAHAPSAYCGVYRHPGYGAVAITEADGALHARLNELDVEIRHRHYDVWEASIATQPLGVALRFETSFAGEIEALTLAVEPAVEPVRFTRSRPARQPGRRLAAAGTYRLGPMVLQIADGGGESLIATLSGLPPRRLVRTGSSTYRMTGYPEGSAVFTLDGSSRSVLVDPWGRFEGEEFA